MRDGNPICQSWERKVVGGPLGSYLYEGDYICRGFIRIYIERERERETDRQTDRDREVRAWLKAETY